MQANRSREDHCRNDAARYPLVRNSVRFAQGDGAEHGQALLFLQDGRPSFVGKDHALELSKVRGLGCRDLHLANYIFAFVMQLVCLGRDGGVVAGEVHINVHGVGRFVTT